MNNGTKFGIIAIAILATAMMVTSVAAYGGYTPVFSFSPENPTDCGPVTFTRTHTNEGHYHIYFGDDSDQIIVFDPDHSGVLTTTHQYDSPGTYEVTLVKMERHWIQSGYWDGWDPTCHNGNPYGNHERQGSCSDHHH